MESDSRPNWLIGAQTQYQDKCKLPYIDNAIQETLLRLIVRFGDFYLDQSCLDKLLEKGHSVNEVDADGNSLLHEAILGGNEGT